MSATTRQKPTSVIIRMLAVAIGFAVVGLSGGQAAVAQTAAPRSINTTKLLSYIQRAPLADAKAARNANAAQLDTPTLRFIDALLAYREGDLEGADDQLRSLLDENPDRRLARFQLAQVLIARERFTAARFHLRQLIGSEGNREVRASYAALDREISRLRPWDFSLSLNAAPRSNANRGSSETIYDANGREFTINDESRAQSGVGFTYSASATRRFIWNETTSFHARGFASGAWYKEDNLRTTRLGAGAFVRNLLGPDGFIDMGVDAARDYVSGTPFDGDIHSHTVTPFANLRHTIATGWVADVRVSSSRVFYEDAQLEDGWRGNATVAATYSPKAGRSFTGYLTQSFERSGRDHFRYDGTSVGLSAYAELPFQLTAVASGSLGQKKFRSPFPGNTFAREDYNWQLGIEFTKRDWAVAGFAPKMGITYEQQTSNISFYTFDDIALTVGVSRSF